MYNSLGQNNSWFTSALIVLPIVLTGCWDDEPEPIPTQQTQVIDRDLFKTKPRPESKTPISQKEPEQDLGLEHYDFPDAAPLLREQQARTLRGQRQWESWQQQNKRDTKPDTPQRYRNSDPDYQQWDEEPVPADVSTFPVDRSRILTADMRISAVLEDSVNSQVPGRVIAVVDRDILSPNGKYILLPSYTKIICKYGSIDKVGKSRLPVMCKRAIRPAGVSSMLTEAQAADQMGRSGLVGEVDNRMWQKYGAAFTMASISALSQMAGNSSSREGINNSANAFSQNLGQVTARVLDEYLDLAPVVTIAAGTRIQIVPENDIYLRRPIQMSEACPGLQPGIRGQKPVPGFEPGADIQPPMASSVFDPNSGLRKKSKGESHGTR